MSENEQRRTKRRKALHTIELIDVMTQKKIGHLVNLSETGMLIIAHETVNADALYQFQFNLVVSDSSSKMVSVGAHELWSDDAAAPGQTWTGFRFIEMGREDLENIRKWVDAPGSQYV